MPSFIIIQPYGKYCVVFNTYFTIRNGEKLINLIKEIQFIPKDEYLIH